MCLCMQMCDFPPCPFPPFSPSVLDKLRQAGLITSKECRMLTDSTDVVRVQRFKSSTVMAKTADVLNRFGFAKESQFLFGKQPYTLMYLSV